MKIFREHARGAMSDRVENTQWVGWQYEALTVGAVERLVAPWSDAQCRAVVQLSLNGNALTAAPACVGRFERLEE